MSALLTGTEAASRGVATSLAASRCKLARVANKDGFVFVERRGSSREVPSSLVWLVIISRDMLYASKRIPIGSRASNEYFKKEMVANEGHGWSESRDACASSVEYTGKYKISPPTYIATVAYVKPFS